MSHQTETDMRAYLDGELDDVPALIVERHMAECADCAAVAAELHETAGIFTAAMARMDAAEPEHWRAADSWTEALPASARVRVVPTVIDPERVIPIGRGRQPASAAPAADHAGASAPAASPRRSVGGAAWRWAAAVVLLAGAGGAAALTNVFGLAAAPDASGEPVAIEATTTAPDPGSVVFVTPVDGVVEVVLSRAPAGSRVIVTRSDDPDVGIEVSGGSVPRIVPTAGRGLVDLADREAVVRIGVPAGLTSVTVVWEGRIVVRVEGGEVTPGGAASEGIVLGGNG